MTESVVHLVGVAASRTAGMPRLEPSWLSQWAARSEPVRVEEKEQLFVRNRPTQTAPKVIYCRSGLVISRRRVGKVVGGIQPRSIPQLIKVPVKVI